MGYMIGVDVGTGSCRVIAFDENGRPAVAVAEEYRIIMPHPGWAEQDPEEIYGGVVRALRRAMREEPLSTYGPEAIDGVALDATMHSIAVARRSGELLTTAMTWGDLRAAEEARTLRDETDSEDLYRRTGCPVHPMYLPAKIRWLRRHVISDGEFGRCRFLSLKEYILHRLTGRLIVDQSVASATGLMNVHTLEWDQSIMQLLGLQPDQLSEPVSPLTVIEGITREAAIETGLPESTKIIVGAADGPLSNPGSGVVDEKRVALMIGTSAAVRTTSSRPLLDPQGRTWCYYLASGKWVPGGATNTGGNSLRWLRDGVFGSTMTVLPDAGTAGSLPETRLPLAHQDDEAIVATYDDLSCAAATVPPGSEGLLFLAFLAGERCPGWNPDARGVLFGLNFCHTRPHIIRATLEGIVYQLYGIYEALVQLAGKPEEIVVSGGFTRSDVWLQIAADVFGHELIIPECAEGSAFGVAALGRVALQQWPSINVVRDMVRPKRRIAPDPRAHELYMELYDQYTHLYRILGDSFREISRTQAGLVGKSSKGGGML